MITTMTLNLWSYHDWKNRKDNVISVIKKLNPDILALQEVQINPSFTVFPQSKIIANLCGYNHHVFAPACVKDKQISISGKATQRATHGLAILSKYPIPSTEAHFLCKHPDHKEPCIVLFADIDINDHLVSVCNVHFGNSDLFADLHLKETMALCKTRRIQPIIQGDFNIYDLSVYRNNELKGYQFSSDELAYRSMPKDNGTLDYIIAPSSGCRINTVVCPEDYISDHRAVFASLTQTK